MRHNAARLETDPLRARDIQLMIERFEKKVGNFMDICDTTSKWLIETMDGNSKIRIIEIYLLQYIS